MLGLESIDIFNFDEMKKKKMRKNMPKKLSNSYSSKTLATLCNATFGLLTENQREKFANKVMNTWKTVDKEKILLLMMTARPWRMPR